MCLHSVFKVSCYCKVATEKENLRLWNYNVDVFSNFNPFVIVKLKIIFTSGSMNLDFPWIFKIFFLWPLCNKMKIFTNSYQPWNIWTYLNPISNSLINSLQEKIVVISSVVPSRDMGAELTGRGSLPPSHARKATQLKQLLERMLALDTTKRATLNQALAHPFLREPMQNS